MSAAIIKTEASQKRRNFVSKFLIYPHRHHSLYAAALFVDAVLLL